MNGRRSKARNLICGIPQGACLGPLLFIIYFNDLESASDDVAKLVADALHESLNLSEWMRVNILRSNPKKLNS